ncbi:hypothetical protein Tco_0148675, partial [Tanacetum coccineum]
TEEEIAFLADPGLPDVQNSQTVITHNALMANLSRNGSDALTEAVRLRYSNPMIQPEPEGSTQGYPLVSVEVLSHGPSDAMHKPLPATQSRKDFVSKLTDVGKYKSKGQSSAKSQSTAE